MPAWLAEMTPTPPPVLAARVEAVVGPRVGPSGVPSPEAYLDAAEELLATLISDGCVSRSSALDLLVADALVTYAFEVAADEPARVAERAERAMARIAAFAVA
jgi:hypothetical protein